MDLFTDPNPEFCTHIGLDCGSCIRRSAASVAAICRGLEAPGARQVFFQLYASPACHPMAQAFAVAYQESSDSQKPVLAFATAAA